MIPNTFKRKLIACSMAVMSGAVYAVDGKILDADGKAINNAVIEIAGSHLSATSDAQGNFTVDADAGTELHIMAPGYAHKTVVIGSGDAKRIVLIRSAIEQTDVVGIPLHVSNLESAIPVTVLTGEDLRNKQAATLGDTLAGEVGVHSNFHGNVASTPIIRGLSGPRVLITQNSLDVSDVSRVGPDHSVAAEASTAEQVEVLRGPATLFYGSGAIGGVVNVVDKRVPVDSETRGEWMLSTDSVNDQDMLSFNLNTGSDNLALHLDGFWRESDDYEVPVSPEMDEDHGERTVANTAEDSHGFTLGASVLLDNGYIGFSYGKLDRDYGVPGHGHGEEEHEEDEHHEDEEHHEEEEHHEDEHGHEEEEMVNLKLKQDRYQILSEINFDGAFFNTLNTRLGYTDYSHTEFENGVVGTTFSNETSEAKFELLHESIGGWHGGLVFDYKNSKFSAEGEEAFAPPSETDSLSFALVEERHFGDVLVQLGARIERVSIKSNEASIGDVEFHPHEEEHHEDEHDDEEHHEDEHHEDEHDEDEHHDEEHEAEIFAFDEEYTPFSVSAGAVWEFAHGYNIGIALSHSERAPSAAELLSFGPHIATGTFEIGALFEAHEDDEEIHFEVMGGKPDMEKSNNIDITFRKFEGDVGIIFNAFYNQVDNYYAQFDTELFAEAGHDHGHEEEEHEGEEHEGEEHEEEGHDEHAGELPVFLFESVDVTLRGFEAQGFFQVTPSLKATLYADYVRAKLDSGTYLPRIPPMRYGLSLDYVQDRVSANFSWTHYDDQEDVAELETSTDGYHWMTASANYRLPLEGMNVSVFVKGENLGDEEARVHSSFIKDQAPRPGRNFRVGIRGTF